MPDPPKKQEAKAKSQGQAKYGVAAAVDANIGPSGRPLINAPLEHGFPSDNNPENYKTLGVPIPKDKVQIPLLDDDNVDWVTFHVPKPLPPGGTQWWLNASHAEKKAAWEADTTGGAGVEDYGDLGKVRRRLYDLMQTLPIHFSILISEIRYQRDCVRHRRRKVRERMQEEDNHTQPEEVKRNSNNGSVKKGSCFSRCGVHTLLAASVIFYSACFHVGIMTLAALVQQWFEIKELNGLFPSSISNPNPVTTRILGVIGMILVLVAMVIGAVAHFFKNNCLLRLYMLMFLGGVGLFAYQSWTEHYYAMGNGLNEVFKKQVKDFLKNGDKSATFLLQAQSKFRCCGDKGPVDFESGAASNGKIQLPPSCCEQLVTRTPDCSMVKGQPILDFVYTRGCTSPVKTFLEHLHMLRLLTTPFLIFGSVVGIIAAINLERYHHFICPCKKTKSEKNAELNPTKHAKQVLFRRTMAEILLDDIEEASTSKERPRRSKFEFENDSVRGSLAHVRRKLGECENITAFILAIVQILHEVEVFQESELGAKRPDPEVIARVILGFRPKRFVTPSLIDHDFERILHDAKFDHKLRSELGRKDLAFRMNMQEILEDQSELLARKEEHLAHHNLMGFPLPRPMNGMRVSEWRRASDDNDGRRITRRDKYTIYEDAELDPLDPAYLEEDRVLHLAAPPGESTNVFSKFCHKTFPHFYELSTEEYVFLEEALYAPAIEVFSKIIGEAQGILCDIHRKARFKKFSLSANLEPPEPTKSRTKSISQANETDVQKVNECLKLLCESGAMQEQRMQRWIRQQVEIANALADEEIQPTFPKEK